MGTDGSHGDEIAQHEPSKRCRVPELHAVRRVDDCKENREHRVEIGDADHFTQIVRVNNGDNDVHSDITRDEYRPSSRTDPLGAGQAVPAVHGDSGAETKER